jgi:hypothetical protein
MSEGVPPPWRRRPARPYFSESPDIIGKVCENTDVISRSAVALARQVE